MKCTPRPNQKAGDAMKGMVRFKQFYRLVNVGQGIEIREIGSRIVSFSTKPGERFKPKVKKLGTDNEKNEIGWNVLVTSVVSRRQ